MQARYRLDGQCADGAVRRRPVADAFGEGRPSRAACATTGSEGTPKADGPCAVLWEGGKAQGKGGKARTACAEGGDAKGKAKGKAQDGRPCAVTLAVRRRRHDEAQVLALALALTLP